jgi:16S rRNA (guanine527-N7)-methyltransferase
VSSGPSTGDALLDVLAEARSAGFLGPGPLEAQVAHARGFTTIAKRLLEGQDGVPRLLDLGSGGGLPGLVIAVEWPEAEVALLEANGRRAAFLARAVDALALGARTSVLHARAESGGREEALRGRFDAVTARSFSRPAVVAECAAPFVRAGGWLIVSEPPGSPEPSDSPGPPDPAGSGQPGSLRWPVEPLRTLGLAPGAPRHEGFDYMVLQQVGPCPDRFPRRDGVPAKRPLF